MSSNKLLAQIAAANVKRKRAGAQLKATRALEALSKAAPRTVLTARETTIYALQRQLVSIVESAHSALALLDLLLEGPHDPRHDVEAPPKRLGRSNTPNEG
jgi:hypothetical protein